MTHAADASTMCEAFQATATACGDRVAIRTLEDEVSISWADYGERVRSVAAGLVALGVGHGDTVGVMLSNRPEFHLVDAAAMHLGAVPFSVYNTYTAGQIEYLLGDAGNEVVVTEPAFLDTIQKAANGVESVAHIVVVGGDEDSFSLDQMKAGGDPDFDFDAAWTAVQPEDLLTIIYTSGTTGPPKGVQLTHANLIAAVRSFEEIIGLGSDGGRVISWLPMAHVAERNCSHYIPMVLGLTSTCCPDPREIAKYLPAVRPSWFFAVPRIWEKLKAGVEATVAAQGDDATKAFENALAAGDRDHPMLAGIREKLGLDHLEAANAGAAPTPDSVLQFFLDLGVPLAELWGMSESCAAGACNPLDHIKVGTVGLPAPGIEIELADDGEVLLRGPVVMAGYRNQPEQTAETIDADGWLHTGDVGEFDEDGYLKIVDRKKELIIGAGGKNMSPANIEAELKSAGPLVGQAVAIGDGRPFVSALIVLDPDAMPDADVHSPEVIEAVQAEIDRANEELARVEQVRRFTILPGDWAPGGDELTPTMKLKRKPIAAKYSEEIDGLYG